MAALGILYLATRGSPDPEPSLAEKPGVPAARAEAVPAANLASEAPVPQKSLEKPAAKAAAEPPSEPLVAEPAEPAAQKPSPSGVTTKPGATRVRLEVHPADSKVGKRGVTQKPPYEFEVPKGRKVVLEVLRKGYITRKVTLDGSSTRVVVGLARARATRGSR